MRIWRPSRVDIPTRLPRDTVEAGDWLAINKRVGLTTERSQTRLRREKWGLWDKMITKRKGKINRKMGGEFKEYKWDEFRGETPVLLLYV